MVAGVDEMRASLNDSREARRGRGSNIVVVDMGEKTPLAEETSTSSLKLSSNWGRVRGGVAGEEGESVPFPEEGVAFKVVDDDG